MYHLKLEGSGEYLACVDSSNGYKNCRYTMNRAEAEPFECGSYAGYVARQMHANGIPDVVVVKPYWFFGQRERIIHP